MTNEIDIQRIATLNVLIDRLLDEQRAYVDIIRRRTKDIAKVPTARLTSYESDGYNRQENSPWRGARDIRDIREMSAKIESIEEFIKDIVQMKLQLFGDVDFDGGDELRAEIDKAVKALKKNQESM